MIKGDIDLTSNMDFRHDKGDNKSSKYLPAIPWKDNKKNDVYISNQSFQIGYNDIGWLDIYPTTSTTVYSNNVNYRVVNNDEFYYEINTVSSTYYNVTFSSSYDSTFNVYTTYNEYDEDSYSIFWNGNWNGKLIESVVNNKQSKSDSIFGKKPKRSMKSLFNKCYRCDHNRIKGFCIKCFRKELLETNSMDVKRKISRGRPDYSPSIYDYYDAHETICNRIDRPRRRSWLDNSDRKIPWLRNLSNSNYNDYITELNGEEVDNSRYLTDTTWLRTS